MDRDFREMLARYPRPALNGRQGIGAANGIDATAILSGGDRM